MGEAETRQKLLRNVKKEVKQIMEEAVTRKFVHADSSHIISFCTSTTTPPSATTAAGSPSRPTSRRRP
ncbi:unnamed protein product [Boreogadus saida]